MQAIANGYDWAGRCFGAGSSLLDWFSDSPALCLHETVPGWPKKVSRRRGFLFLGIERRRLHANI
jgi:hypothetical protein